MKILPMAAALQATMVEIRRDFHAYPELGYEETRTADVIARWLEKWGIPFHRGLAGTGIVATIHGALSGNGDGPAIGFRADMDALPIHEANTFAHASAHDGKMHACGHDGHMAMLLGAAHCLRAHRDFSGTVHLIFQPAEETGAGARRMIDDGLFDLFPMEAVFGMHNWPGLAVGQFGVVPGPMMASANLFDVTILGKGSHAAQPQYGADPVMIAVQVAQAWQTIVSRNRDPVEPAVLSITQIHGGSAYNVIPDSATMAGTVRTFSQEMTDLIETRMRNLLMGICEAFGARAEFSFKRNYPPLVNHEPEIRHAVAALRQLVPGEQINERLAPTMGSEDFAFMLQEKPGCYIFIGNGEGAHRDAGYGGGPCQLHNPSYDFNDTLLPLGASYWVELAHQRLAR